MLEVTVTQTHIDRGDRGKCGTCPVALALKSHYAEVSVSSCHAYTRTDRNADWTVTRLPHDACRFIQNFDADRAVLPFTFTLGDDPNRPLDPYETEMLDLPEGYEIPFEPFGPDEEAEPWHPEGWDWLAEGDAE